MFIFHFKTISGSIRSLWGLYGVLWGTMGFYGVKRRTGFVMMNKKRNALDHNYILRQRFFTLQ